MRNAFHIHPARALSLSAFICRNWDWLPATQGNWSSSPIPFQSFTLHTKSVLSGPEQLFWCQVMQSFMDTFSFATYFIPYGGRFWFEPIHFGVFWGCGNAVPSSHLLLQWGLKYCAADAGSALHLLLVWLSKRWMWCCHAWNDLLHKRKCPCQSISTLSVFHFEKSKHFDPIGLFSRVLGLLVDYLPSWSELCIYIRAWECLALPWDPLRLVRSIYQFLRIQHEKQA